MESKPNPVALVKSPSKDAHIRKSRGFSLKEIEEAGKSIDLLRKSKVQIDYFRKSAHPENIKRLQSLKSPSVDKKKKRKPFVKKEKKETPFKPKEEKLRPKSKKIVKEKPKAAIVKTVEKPKKKEKVKPVKVMKEDKVPFKPSGKPLTDLSGLGVATAKKFIELGVSDIETLSKENPEELAPLIKGVTVERLRKWIDEAKEFIK
jgi:predicted flap endonuclease-1-like 5' DNA nuclease